MRPKSSEKSEAIILRKTGLSLNEIAARLSVSKSSTSLWLRDVRISELAQKRISAKRTKAYQKSAETHRNQTRERLEEAAVSAEKTFAQFNLDRNSSMILCALLYWCEGEKTKNDQALTFTNSDPSLIATFLHLMRRSFKLKERKFRICLHLHEYHEQEKQIQFWSRLTRVPRSQFSKTYWKSHTGKRKREGYAGCASIRYYDTRIAREIQALARAILKKYGPIVQW